MIKKADVKEQTSDKVRALFCEKDALNNVLNALAYASEEVYCSLLEVCKQIVKEMYGIFYG